MNTSSLAKIPHAIRCSAAWVGMAVLMAASSSLALADQYYHGIDSSGNLYLGDQPPPEGVAGVTTRPVPAFAPPLQSPQTDPYSIMNQSKRLAEQREARARELLEKRRAEREYLLQKRALERGYGPQPSQNAPVYVLPQIYPYGRYPSFAPRPRRDYGHPGDRFTPWRGDRTPWQHPQPPIHTGQRLDLGK